MTRDIDRRRATSSLDSLTVFLDQATRDIDRLAAAGDYVALGDGLGRLRVLKRALADLERHAEDELAPLLPHKVTEEAGLWMERKTSTNRRAWQSEDIVRELWTGTFADPNGVLDPVGQSERFLEAIKACVPLTGSLGWRVKALEQYGIDPEEYCEETPGRTTVRVEQAKGNGDAIAPSDAD